jgi:hypothetical protein
VLLSGGLGPGHPIGTDYGDPVGGGACRHGEAKPPDAPRRDSADVPIPAPGHAAALVQPLNPDPNAPGVHRSVVEHAPTHCLQARNRLVRLPLYPQGCSSHRFLRLACRWVQDQQAHESEVPHQSRSHVHHSRAGSDESRETAWMNSPENARLALRRPQERACRSRRLATRWKCTAGRQAGRTYTNGAGAWTTIYQLGQRELPTASATLRPLNPRHVRRVHWGELRMELAH